MKGKAYIFLALLLACLCLDAAAQNRGSGSAGAHDHENDSQLVPQVIYAWRPSPITGDTVRAVVDTLEQDYYRQAIPSMVTYAWACTGNFGAEGKDMLAASQPQISQFFLQDAKMAWTPSLDKLLFYNSRMPMTLVSYNTGGGRDNSQDRLQTIFSGNINARAQLGATLDYIYSRGCYANQEAKGLTWSVQGSYMGERYQMQAWWAHYNLLNKENGGITDDLYITDPALMQGGVSSINPKSIPTHLSHARTRIVGGELFVSNKYSLGIKRKRQLNDSISESEYVPVTSFFWTVNYKMARHVFADANMAEMDAFYGRAYLNPDITDDRNNYSSMRNTVGVQMLEGFSRYAKFGLSAFATIENRRFVQTVDTVDRLMDNGIGLTPFPEGVHNVLARKTQNVGWIGAVISKRQGSILQYRAVAELGVIGDAAGEVKVSGSIDTRIPLLGDTVAITGYGRLANVSAPYLMQQYISNHFIWNNDFGKERRLRLGGRIEIPWTDTKVDVSTETLQNFIYFGPDAVPLQHNAAVQVLSAAIEQNITAGILHWDNKVTYQTTTDDAVMPLPRLALYSNLYIKCRIATLSLQLGVDCDYYTSYYAPAYQPATATFYNQREMKLGNCPFANVYANMKLGRVRFYVMMSHINQGWPSKAYFSSPHYPLNPRRFQMGLSVEFRN